jgi:2-polyprenyl-3-methyl-5-hydroxy-6-metoxy-1,4-benzoquinol methylase
VGQRLSFRADQYSAPSPVGIDCWTGTPPLYLGLVSGRSELISAFDHSTKADPIGATPKIDVRAVLARYRGESPFIRLFTFGRHLLAPLERVAAEVPPTGRVLDLGCGHGLFTNLLALQAPGRDLLGVDPSSAKIAVARRSSAGLNNVSYLQGQVGDVDESGFRAITILDVLYLLPDEQKLTVLRRCRELIAPDGVLLLKTNDTRPRWKYAIVRLEEELMVHVLGLTFGGQLHFRGIPEYTSLLRTAGFESHVLSIDTNPLVPHRLYLCSPARC